MLEQDKLLTLARITHLVMFVRACLAVHAQRKRYVPSRNSFIQLRKNSDDTQIVTPLELNATTFIAADAKVASEVSSEETTTVARPHASPV